MKERICVMLNQENVKLTSAIKSMTGYGVARGESETSYLEVNVKSVNGRFLEVRLHLPREFNSIESDLRKIISEYFKRGSVDVFISRKFRGDKSNLKLLFHEEMARAWIGVSSRLETLSTFKSSLDINTLIQLPEVVGFEEEQTGIDREAQLLKQIFQQACQSCQQEREREGEALQKELLQILARLDQQLLEMNGVSLQVNQHLKDKMQTRLKARWSDLEIDSQRFQQELALLWDKSDITEELSRLKEHLQHYRKLLSSTNVQGKKLDFYTQELLREVNTIGSKSPMVQLTHIVVTAKTEIEKLREQVQNIE